MFVDGSSNENGGGAGLILVSSKGHRVHSALRFGFDASNNEAEYEDLIFGLRASLELKAEGLKIFSDSQLVVNQILREYQAQGTEMAAYLAKTQEMLDIFKRFTIRQVPMEHNSNVDALAKLATTKDAELLNVVPIDYLASPSITTPKEVKVVQSPNSWMRPVLKYLVFRELPQNKKVAQKLLY
ncbi:uncharacterized protein LOC133805709 [Humulus lupulus]|uniref:uncharacterized protein LOC133805709 n=1 Tax=Humulus lupulus TaxID=3486 RepID=UPI002B4117CF|nr:uncharacterized protein LOC133805709 [Humulus lupulus]